MSIGSVTSQPSLYSPAPLKSDSAPPSSPAASTSVTLSAQGKSLAQNGQPAAAGKGSLPSLVEQVAVNIGTRALDATSKVIAQRSAEAQATFQAYGDSLAKSASDSKATLESQAASLADALKNQPFSDVISMAMKFNSQNMGEGLDKFGKILDGVSDFFSTATNNVKTDTTYLTGQYGKIAADELDKASKDPRAASVMSNVDTVTKSIKGIQDGVAAMTTSIAQTQAAGKANDALGYVLNTAQTIISAAEIIRHVATGVNSMVQIGKDLFEPQSVAAPTDITPAKSSNISVFA